MVEISLLIEIFDVKFTSYICDIKIKYIFFNIFELIKGNEVKVEDLTFIEYDK